MKNAKLIALLLGTAMLATACGGGGGGNADVSGPTPPSAPTLPITPPSAPVDPVDPITPDPIAPSFNAEEAVNNLFGDNSGRQIISQLLDEEITSVDEFRSAVSEISGEVSPLSDADIEALIAFVEDNSLAIDNRLNAPTPPAAPVEPTAEEIALAVYDSVYATQISNGQTSYIASTKAAIAASHSRGWTGNGVNVTVVDGFSHGVTHGSTVRSVTDAVAPGASMTNIDVAVANGGPDLGIAFNNAANVSILQDSDVINISIGAVDVSQATITANADFLRGLNISGLATIAAGNEGRSCSTVSDCNGVAQSAIDAGIVTIVVGAINDDGLTLKDYSNEAGILANDFISAPVLTAEEGTSFAAPLVAGTAALIMDKFDNTDAQDTKNIIFDTADDLGVAGVDAIYGHGALNIGAALSPVGNLR